MIPISVLVLRVWASKWVLFSDSTGYWIDDYFSSHLGAFWGLVFGSAAARSIAKTLKSSTGVKKQKIKRLFKNRFNSSQMKRALSFGTVWHLSLLIESYSLFTAPSMVGNLASCWVSTQSDYYFGASGRRGDWPIATHMLSVLTSRLP